MGSTGLSSKTVDAVDRLAATWAEVDRLRPAVLLKRPIGSFTLNEYADRYNLRTTTAREQLYRLVKSKDLVRALVQEPGASGRLANVWCYSIPATATADPTP